MVKFSSLITPEKVLQMYIYIYIYIYISVIRLGERGILWWRRNPARGRTLPQLCWRRFKQFEKLLPVYWYIGVNTSENIAAFIFRVSIPVSTRSKALVCCCSLAAIAGSSPAGNKEVCLFECCVLPVQVSAKGQSLVESSPTEWVCGWVWSRNHRQET